MSDIDNTQDQPTIEQLRAMADENSRLKQQLAIQDTERFMQVEAGIPMTPAGKAFAAQYNGELTPEKVQEAAVAWGLYNPESENRKEAEQQPSAVDEARETLQGRGSAPNADEPPKRHPAELAREEYERITKAGGRESDARKAGLIQILGAAIEGDQRVLIQNPNGLQRTGQTAEIPFQSGRKGVTG